MTSQDVLRRFLIVSHTCPPDGAWGLDDLAGGAGRVDVLCRAIQCALTTSHGVRQDTQAVIVFTADATRPTAVRIDGATVRLLNPDERSTAARLRTALKARPEDPWWEPVDTGIDVAPFTLEETLADIGGTPVCLDAKGTPLAEANLPDDAVWILSDHKPLDPVPGADIVSLGTTWYQGNQVVAVVQWWMDQGSR